MRSMTRAQSQALDRLYAEFNYPDSATDPIQIVRRYSTGRRSRGRRVLAAALAFGRVASVLQSIERVLAIMGARPGGVRPALRSGAPRRRLRRRRAPLDPRARSRRADLGDAPDDRSRRIDRRRSLPRATMQPPTTSAPALDSFSTRALALDLDARAYGRQRCRAAITTRRLLLLSAALGGQRVQAAEPVPALDGAPRRARPRRVDARLAGAADRAARHACHSRRPMPAADALHRVPGGRWRATSRHRFERWIRTIPVKYDFALCHLGMMNACGFSRAQADAQCPLRGLCRPRARRRQRSRRPSARR